MFSKRSPSAEGEGAVILHVPYKLPCSDVMSWSCGRFSPPSLPLKAHSRCIRSRSLDLIRFLYFELSVCPILSLLSSITTVTPLVRASCTTVVILSNTAHLYCIGLALATLFSYTMDAFSVHNTKSIAYHQRHFPLLDVPALAFSSINNLLDLFPNLETLISWIKTVHHRELIAF